MTYVKRESEEGTEFSDLKMALVWSSMVFEASCCSLFSTVQWFSQWAPRRRARNAYSQASPYTCKSEPLGGRAYNEL
jgi:hypothetical protein